MSEQEPEQEQEQPKPPPEEDLPMSGEELTGEELNVDLEEMSAEEFLGPEQAREDPRVDDEEQEEQPHTDLPEGTRAADYEAQEGQDGGEETPPAERGQREG
jgi:hypothetical protein